MDLETFPVKDTVRMVASLLQQITLANDHRAYTPASPVSPTSSPPLYSFSSSSSTPSTTATTTATASSSSSSSSSSKSISLNPPSSTTHASTTVAPPSLLPNHHPMYSRFYAQTVPSISILSYLNRILKYAPCSNCVFLSILVYLDRMTTHSKYPFILCSPNIHRCIIVCVMVATKFASDVFYTNAHYAKVGSFGIPYLDLSL
ncbi:hypothetical protein HMI55_000024 [Coelomomyces lativittatus]|nr:hypothetical protein HMI55_000024 [Coelomomyces lativittatus]